MYAGDRADPPLDGLPERRGADAARPPRADLRGHARGHDRGRGGAVHRGRRGRAAVGGGARQGQPERQTILAGYALDRTEVPNGFAKAMGAALVAAGYALPLYPDSDQLYQGSEPPWPITAIARRDAAMLCAMAGKRLPSSLEWQKAMRGGATIVGRPNPYPRRNLPWGPPRADALANLKPPEVADRLRFGAPIATGAMPGDVGPYGHLDLAGNVSEWTTADDPRGLAIVRGGNWAETEPDWLVDFLAIDNPRAPNTTMYHIGFRCAVSARP
ncbi:MAG: SUMF1/EgtB/PvdO family nonheme iron enzyme [Myxococcales bacterium]|nr:SUMF1/EgtB/PvdO family nonheme iron enzyme [Myxococcales bacterium]